MIRPYSTPEFLSSVGIVPYDHEADMAQEQFRQLQASGAYRRALKRAEEKQRRRRVMGAIVFVTVCFALGFAVAYL